jgi:predicted RNA-binding Zn-ribbon protein involved in translation (DUF1610 family)
MDNKTSTRANETDTYCYSCGIQFIEGFSPYTCPECNMANCQERLSRQQYGTPSEKVYQA